MDEPRFRVPTGVRVMLFCLPQRRTLRLYSRTGGTPVVEAGAMLHVQGCDVESFERPADATVDSADLADLSGAESAAVLSVTDGNLLTNCNVRAPPTVGTASRTPVWAAPTRTLLAAMCASCRLLPHVGHIQL